MVALKEKDRLGDWRVDRKLGGGGQAQVWRARHVSVKHSPPAALKLSLTADAKATARFEREVELLRSVSHPGVVAVRDAGTYNGHPFLVMELATTTLDRVGTADTAGTRILRESPGLILRFLREACAGLSALHKMEILHRDIKPSNILLLLDPPEPMRAVLADLGIASSDGDQGRLTATHEVVGTPAYRAPESLRGTHSYSSDVYSFGKTIEGLFARGEPAAYGPGRCVRDDSLTDAVWDRLDKVLARACAYDPSDRYKNATELLGELPSVVMSLTSSFWDTESENVSPAPIELSTYECITLGDVFAKCPTTKDFVLLDDLRSSSRLSDFHFSLAIRGLTSLDFLKTQTADDEDGFHYTFFEPSRRATEWFLEHHDKIDDARAQIPEPERPPVDIPF